MNLSLLKHWKTLNNYLRNLVKDTLKAAIISSKNNQNISKMHKQKFLYNHKLMQQFFKCFVDKPYKPYQKTNLRNFNRKKNIIKIKPSYN